MLTLRNMLVSGGREVVDANLVAPGEVGGEVRHVDIRMRERLCDALSILEGGCRQEGGHGRRVCKQSPRSNPATMY